MAYGRALLAANFLKPPLSTSFAILRLVTVKDMRDEWTSRIQFDKVVPDIAMKPDQRLYESVRAGGLGDAVSPRRIGDAVKEGFRRPLAQLLSIAGLFAIYR